MQNRWILVIDNYETANKKAVNLLCGTLSGYLDYVLPVKFIDDISDDQIKPNNIIVVGKPCSNRILDICVKNGLIDVPNEPQSYCVFVGKSVLNDNTQMVAIAANDDAGILYACADFCNKYCGDVIYRGGDIWANNFYDKPFNREIPEWKISIAPAIKTRAIWTWGHVIYDYRKFLDNMAKLRLNQVVIWNDIVPLNANDVVEYAHSLSIKVIWGFAWGWSTVCADAISNFSEQEAKDLKEQVLNIYKTQYASTKGDGIYFQSFTELNTDSVNGKNIAETVTDLVNDIGGALLGEYPDLHIQFGLHATSVKTHLDIIKRTDKRIHIVWEDCGAFPYDYYPDNISNFDQTYALTKQLLTLRGSKEKFGAVLKGMLKLDWGNFEHFKDSYILGERTNSFIKNRQIAKNKIWKTVQASWLKNAEYLRKIVALAAEQENEPIFQTLVEDAMFENQIMLPVALYAEILWTPKEDIDKLKEQVAKYPQVDFANL